jgi:hypothetical protein
MDPKAQFMMRVANASAKAKGKRQPFRPDYSLTPAEALTITLNLALNKHIPNWPGCTDEQLEAVAEEVIEHVKNERGNIFK